MALKSWLLRFGQSSETLRHELAQWSNWLANSNPPWAAIRAMMACRLVALDKEPGTRPVGIGEVYRRLMAKCVLRVVGDRATRACGNLNLCAGLKAGIEGAVHAVRETWEAGGVTGALATYGDDSDAPANAGPAESSTCVTSTTNSTTTNSSSGLVVDSASFSENA